jgi:hypothetical protein
VTARGSAPSVDGDPVCGREPGAAATMPAMNAPIAQTTSPVRLTP